MNSPKKTEVTNVTNNLSVASPPTLMQVISDAVERGTDVTVMEKMFDLYERDQALIAAREFNAAMAEFQSTVPVIKKSKKADRYTFAPLDEILRTIQSHLAANGLSVRFDTKYEKDGYLTAICTVAHKSGHKEVSTFDCPVDTENRQKITGAQQQGSANSYAKRYALGNALNLVYSDDIDDDGASAGVQYLSADQAIEIRDLITEKKVDVELFLKWAGATSYETIKADRYARIKREYTQ